MVPVLEYSAHSLPSAAAAPLVLAWLEVHNTPPAALVVQAVVPVLLRSEQHMAPRLAACRRESVAWVEEYTLALVLVGALVPVYRSPWAMA